MTSPTTPCWVRTGGTSHPRTVATRASRRPRPRCTLRLNQLPAVHRLTHGATLDSALDTAADELRAWPGHAETVMVLDNARRLAARARPTPGGPRSLGGGWTGEEALAIAVCAALSATDLRDGLLLAVNHSGDSDSTGALCGNLLGNLLGTRHGATAVPVAWREELELHDLIEDLACRLTHQL